jgi:hypothetical protein
MTLVVTEVSEKFGCVVVGDSAVTIGTSLVLGVEKVHYSDEARLGFAIWGNACLAGQRVDELVSSFVSKLTATASPRSAGHDLAQFLSDEGTKDGRDWERLRGGVHLCGYQADLPVLFHVHTGHNPPARRERFQLYEDYPDASEGFHLRNGYYQMFASLFEGMQSYVSGLKELKFGWPHEAVEHRVSYYSILVDTVAKTLVAAGRLPSVGAMVSALAFNRNGIQVDKRLPRGRTNYCDADGDLKSFSEFPFGSVNLSLHACQKEQRVTASGVAQ